MSMFYQPVPTALFGPKRNNGLRILLEEIGKNEYSIMENRAILEGKDSFYFPSGHKRKSLKIKCFVKQSNPVTNDMYYKQGIYRINKEVRLGGMNKTAINRLVESFTEKGRDGDGYNGTYNYFYLHRIKAEQIFLAVRRYIVTKYTLPACFLEGSKSRNLMVQTKRKVFGDGVPARSGADIVATPYYDVISGQDLTFAGKDGILEGIRAFNSITGEGGVL